MEFKHYGYINNDKALMEKKFIRNVDILKNQLKLEPENIYYLYELSSSYTLHGDIEKALEIIIKAAEIAKLQNKSLYKPMYVFIQLAYMYLLNKEFIKTEQICTEANMRDSIYIDLYFYLAKARFNMNKDQDAIDSYKIYLEKVERFSVVEMSKNISINHYTLCMYEDAYIDLSILYDRQNNYKLALDFAKKIKTKKNFKNGISRVISLCIKLNDYFGLKNYYYNEILETDTENKEYFRIQLERTLLGLNRNIRNNVYKVFTEGSTEYNLLNVVRLSKERLQEEIINEIYAIDFNQLPDYFGDFIYNLLCYKISISEILNKTNDFKIKSLFLFLINSHDDFSSKLYEYLKKKNIEEQKFDVLRVNKSIAFYSLSVENIEEEQYKELFNFYLKCGWGYLKEVYNSAVIENELVNCMKDEEDLFLMYMLIAQNNKSNRSIYIRNLRNALKASNYMKRGIEIVLEELKEDIVIQNNEMELYMKKVKENISNLINVNNIKDAKALIEEYESIIKDDSEINSMKAVISIMENRLEEAEGILITTLEGCSDNFDLTYNLAYVYQQMGNKQKALFFYKKSVNLVSNLSLAEDINSIIEYLEK